MIRNLAAKPVLLVLSIATVAILGYATLFVLAVAVQSTQTSAHPLTSAASQQFDESARNESAQNAQTGPRQDSPEAEYASTPQSGDGSGRQDGQPGPASFEANAAQNPQYAPAAYTSGAGGWTEQGLPDGSATLALPANWRITGGAKGAVEIEGPNSEEVVLGFQTFVMANQAPYMGPEQALAWFLRSHGVQLLGIEKRDAQQAASGQAELIVGESEAQGRKHKIIARVTTSQIGMGNWMLQISSMGAPVEHFDADFPAMQKIWNSWKLNNGYVQGGFDNAARIHAETTQMAVDHAQSTLHRWDSFNESMDQNIRGVSTMENSTMGKRVETQIGTERQYLDNCRRRGMDCRQVPTNELVPQQ